MNPLRWSFRRQCLLGFFACAGLIGYAIYLQFVEQLQPCPFCIFQRVAFAGLGLVFLLAAMHGPRKAAPRKRWGIFGAAAALVGAGIAARHVWVQLYPPDIPACGPGISFMVEQRGWVGTVNKVLTGSGDCSDIDWMFLGLSMPMWSLVWFVLLGAWVLWAGFVRRRQH
ncbi:MAG: disulfide bond formation protein B [Pseudoxanthomonas suwonensis]|nr:disulfide bond formation protein B [Pseudoxanthomonas suwonensis]